MTVLSIKNLAVSFDTPDGEIQAVRGVSFSLEEGEVLALVGESGCGKSVLCKSIMGLLPGIARLKSGSIKVCGREITGYREKERRRLRGQTYGMVFQDPLTALTPTLSIGRQIEEAVALHDRKASVETIKQRVCELMELVGIPHPRERYGMYPCQFSGGMRQRVVMAIALAARPKILFADEPTTSLDVTMQGQILDLLRKIQKKQKMSTIFVTHDLAVAARVADRVAVMYAGKIVEIGTAEEIFNDPRHPYTWGLMRSLPAFSRGKQALYAIPGMPPDLLHPPKGDAFAARNTYAMSIDYEEEPPLFPISETHFAATWLLHPQAPEIRPPKLCGFSDTNRLCGDSPDTNRLCGDSPDTNWLCGDSPDTNWLCGISPDVTLSRGQTVSELPDTRSEINTPKSQDAGNILVDVRRVSRRFMLNKKKGVRALWDVSFPIYRGEIFGLVGESGSGKSTMARCLMNIIRPERGQILYKGIDTCDPARFHEYKDQLQTERQMIFQDSASSLNPRMRIRDIIAEPLKVSRKKPPRGSLEEELLFQMEAVGLDPACLNRFPQELSGGQRQRAAIARALTMEPELLVADEPVAALDVSMQAQMVNLFRHLQQEHGFTFLFIAHDLSMVEFLCDRVGVLYQGRLVEMAPTRELFTRPRHPYTRNLLSAIPIPDPAREKKRTIETFRPEPGWLEGTMTECAPRHYVLV